MLYIASDHAGYELKQKIIKIIKDIVVTDLGCDTEDSVDYPDYAHKLYSKIGDNDRGILICGTGIGMSMTANRHKHIRAALIPPTENDFSNKKSISVVYTEFSRKHNNANVLVLPGRFMSFEQAWKCICAFLQTDFEGGRHKRRIDKLGLLCEKELSTMIRTSNKTC